MNRISQRVLGFHSVSWFRLEFYLILLAMTVLEIAGMSMIHKIVPGAGLVLLPLYFFVLTGYLFFGAQIGFALAFFLPLSSWLMTGMPSGAMFLAVWLKSLALCGFLYVLSRVFLNVYWALVLSLIGYQVFGFLVLLSMGFSGPAVFGDVLVGYPGLLLQLGLGLFSLLLMGRRK